jgi:hypothetical protein
MLLQPLAKEKLNHCIPVEHVIASTNKSTPNVERPRFMACFSRSAILKISWAARFSNKKVAMRFIKFYRKVNSPFSAHELYES